MPLFEFNCPNCNFLFEELAAHNEEVKCPECNNIASRANLFESIAKPIVKGNSIDGTGRSYIESGDRMIGYHSAAAWEKIEDRDNQKRRIMFKHNTTSLARYNITEVEKTYTGKERKAEKVEYEPLVGEDLKNFIDGHKKAQKIAKEGNLKTEDNMIPKSNEKKSK